MQTARHINEDLDRERVYLRAVLLAQRNKNSFFRGNKCPSLKPMLINASLLSYRPMDINGEEHKSSLSLSLITVQRISAAAYHSVLLLLV